MDIDYTDKENLIKLHNRIHTIMCVAHFGYELCRDLLEDNLDMDKIKSNLLGT